MWFYPLFIGLVTVISSGFCREYLPFDFTCTGDKTVEGRIYSFEGANERKVDLVNILCGRVVWNGLKYVASGYHAQPDGIIPETVLLNEETGLDSNRAFQTAHQPYIKYTYGGTEGYVLKEGDSTIWPTVWSANTLIGKISTLDRLYRPQFYDIDLRDLCINRVFTDQFAPSVMYDVKIEYEWYNNEFVIKTAYPIEMDRCLYEDELDYYVTTFEGWES